MGTDSFVNDWLKKYYLSTKKQQQYFWAHILCICAKIKQIDIEIENTLVTIPKRNNQSQDRESLFSNSSEVEQEQQDALLYKGFLVPPVLGENVADGNADNANITIEQVRQSIESQSKTRVLSKCQVWATLRNEDDAEFVYVHDNVMNQTKNIENKPINDRDQFFEDEVVLFRFAEIVRKYVIESKYLKNNIALWPYYKNHLNRDQFKKYHTFVNRFNLATMITKDSIFQLFKEKDDDNESISCFGHCSCQDYCTFCQKDEFQDGEKEDLAIRHRRKYAATLLLSKWNTLRNLNILRQQFTILFSSIIDGFKKQYDQKQIVLEPRHNQQWSQIIEDDEQEFNQQQMVKEAKSLDKKYWKEKIKKINKELQKNLKSKKSGWQFLSHYKLKDNNTIEITITQYPLFEKFCRYFLYEDIKKDRQKINNDLNADDWYSEFKRSWISVPVWWTKHHDLILLELALKHNMDHEQYIEELKGDKAFYFRQRLKDQAGYLEFQHWCEQLSNILHRLKYITNAIIDNLNEIKPSLVDIRTQETENQETELIFSHYEKEAHLDHVHEHIDLPLIRQYKPTSKAAEWNDDDGRYKEMVGPVVDSIVSSMNKNWPVPNVADEQKNNERSSTHETQPSEKTLEVAKVFERVLSTDTQQTRSKKRLSRMTGIEMSHSITTKKDELEALDEEHDDDDEHDPKGRVDSDGQPPQFLKIKSVFSGDDDENDDEDNTPIPNDNAQRNDSTHTADPFITRDLQNELYEVINAFDVIKYGKYMAQLIINEIKEFGMDELWTCLEVVMEAVPFSMALEILNEELDTLRRGSPDQLESLCRHILEGTNWRIAAALRMAEYFESIAKYDEYQKKAWLDISTKFENVAHEDVNQIESDHLLYILLTIPLYDTHERMSILKLALEQKRISFLNNERIISIAKHIWHRGNKIDIADEIMAKDLSFSELLPILFYSPFKFYLSPCGFNYTLSILYFMYLIFVLSYSYSLVTGRVDYFFDLSLWIFNLGMLVLTIFGVLILTNLNSNIFDSTKNNNYHNANTMIQQKKITMIKQHLRRIRII